jgi:hypothetical protein
MDFGGVEESGRVNQGIFEGWRLEILVPPQRLRVLGNWIKLPLAYSGTS